MAGQLPRVVGVIGAGQMGQGIAQVAAMAGLRVHLVDKSASQLSKGMTQIEKSMQKLVSKGKLEEGRMTSALQSLSTSESLECLRETDCAIEAVPEIESLKAGVLKTADSLLPAHAVLASNTSSISITRLAAATQRPSQVIGLHFMNPVPLMSLIELVRGMQTSEETFQTSQALAKLMGKQTCVSQDRPGFIVNRILMPMINEAFYTLSEGVASPEDIDLGMKLGTNQPMGPLALADLIGLDTCHSIMEVLYAGLGRDKYAPCPLLRTYVDAGWLGRKVGRGVYKY